SPKNYSKEFATFQLPCGKCIKCRLEYARSAAIRCVHEAKIHLDNSFVTLTYSDEHLESPKLIYAHIQKFIKDLRDHIFRDYTKRVFGKDHWKNLTSEQKKFHLKTYKGIYDATRISVFVTGEYGDDKKRPHWHLLIFNWSPSDRKYLRQNDRGDKIYTSHTLDTLWGRNDPEKKPNEIGDVNFHSAGYCARYAAKKLAHGQDQQHEYHPIHRRSSKHAIGKRFLEKYWKDIFTHGECIIMDETGKIHRCPIPRYYERWLEKHHPGEYVRYVTQTKAKKTQAAATKQEQINQKEFQENWERLNQGLPLQTTQLQAEEIILKDKFNRLQKARQGE
ncbi:MAG: hypothetical protein AB7T49_21675, partial [Oligoflexales bacterium]